MIPIFNATFGIREFGIGAGVYVGTYVIEAAMQLGPIHLSLTWNRRTV